MNKIQLVRYTPSTRDKVLHRLRNMSEAMPFHVGRHFVHEFPKIGLILACVEPATQLIPGSQHTYIEGDDFLTFDGVPLFEGQDVSRPWAQRLFELFVRYGPAGFFDRVMGDYCVTVKHGPRLFAFGDFAGLCPIFYGENTGTLAIGNRQRLLQSILLNSDKATLDPEACAFITGQGNMFGENSIYEGIKLIAPSRYLMLDEGGAKLGGFSRFYAQERRSLSEADGSAAADAIFKQARCFAELPVSDYQMDLTGGMDSRAVLAIALQSGLMNKVSSLKTYGPEGMPEFEVTSELARIFNLPHENVNTKTAGNASPEDHWRRLRYNAMALDGAVSADTGMPGPMKTSFPCLSGTGGELFRPHIRSRRDLRLTSVDGLNAMVENYQRTMDPLGVHGEGVTEALRKTMRDIARHYVSQGVPFDDVHYLFYAEHRLPWWAGYALSNLMGRRRLFPLVNKEAARIVYSGSPELKKMDWLHFMLMKQADPRLIQIPFYENTWDARLKGYSGGLPMADRPFPIKSATPTLSTGSWMTEFAEAEWDRLFDYVLSSPSSQIFQFVDRARLEQRWGERKWASRLASASALLSLVSFRMVEANDMLPAKQGVPLAC